jgi:GntR family transcriptional regulator, transcriptional repressor for pyruvate dehydrogenase complex
MLNAPWAPDGRSASGVRLKVSDAIIKSLRIEIASGRLALGTKLPSEKELASNYGVSQPTIREAVRALDAMGLLETRHGSGVYVTKSTTDFVTNTLQTLLQMERVSMLDALAVRRVLGSHSAALAAKNATAEDVEAMRVATQRCDDAQDVQEFVEATVAFQVAFSAAAHNPLIFALETFLIRIVMQFQVHVNGEKGLPFWRKQAEPYAGHRHRMIEYFDTGKRDQVPGEWCAYLDDLDDLFQNDPVLSVITLSDPDAIRTVDEIVLNIPSY